jgi:hypothetical protein
MHLKYGIHRFFASLRMTADIKRTEQVQEA